MRVKGHWSSYSASTTVRHCPGVHSNRWPRWLDHSLAKGFGHLLLGESQVARWTVVREDLVCNEMVVRTEMLKWFAPRTGKKWAQGLVEDLAIAWSESLFPWSVPSNTKVGLLSVPAAGPATGVRSLLCWTCRTVRSFGGVRNVGHRSEGENGAETVGAFGHKKDKRAAGAMTTQVDTVGIDELLLAKKLGRSQHVIHLAQETLLGSRVVAAAKDGNIMTIPALRKALADWSSAGDPSFQHPLSMELQSPPVIQIMAGCFLSSLGSGVR